MAKSEKRTYPQPNAYMRMSAEERRAFRNAPISVRVHGGRHTWCGYSVTEPDNYISILGHRVRRHWGTDDDAGYSPMAMREE